MNYAFFVFMILYFGSRKVLTNRRRPCKFYGIVYTAGLQRDESGLRKFNAPEGFVK